MQIDTMSKNNTKHSSKHTGRWFFFEPENEIANLPQDVTITDKRTIHHAKNVLRLKTGDEFTGVNLNTQTAYLTSIQAIDKDTMTLTIKEEYSHLKRSSLSITLGVGLIKEQRWDWLIQKTTELGVDTIIPLTTQHTVVKPSNIGSKLDRWQRIARSAAEQSEGVFIATVQKPLKLADFVEHTKNINRKFILCERDETSNNPIPLSKKEDLTEVAVAIGPEGGWTDEEIQTLIENKFIPVNLGNRILRTETAATTILGILNYEHHRQ